MTPRMPRFLVSVVLAMALVPALTAAQEPVAALTGRGVPSGVATATPLALSLADAIDRGLSHNLAAIVETERLRGTESSRLAALSEVLPHVSGSVRRSEQQLSTAAFGFSLPDLPRVIGPFGLIDGRVSVSTPLFDARALQGVRSVGAAIRAGQADAREIREAVVLAVGNLYLEVQADARARRFGPGAGRHGRNAGPDRRRSARGRPRRRQSTSSVSRSSGRPRGPG